MRLSPLLLLLLLCTACNFDRSAGPADAKELVAIRAELAALKARPEQSAPNVELGQQMLELQIRHARLWQAGKARNWLLAQFQLAEMREALEGVVEVNGDHAALQPQRLADVLPAMMNPAIDQLQKAVDDNNGAAFDTGYDALSAACTACHTASDHGFLVIQRPLTPVLDNLRAEPLP